MGVIFWWMPLLWAAIVVAVIAGLIFWRRRNTPEPPRSRAIAHTSRLTSLPGYRSAMRRYRALVAVVSAAAVILLVGAIAVASRPATSTAVQSNLDSRDIVLCLDVSGSMIDYDSELVDVFAKLTERFDGERISLVVFNASAVTYFPLTSDYDYVADQLRDHRRSVRQRRPFRTSTARSSATDRRSSATDWRPVLSGSTPRTRIAPGRSSSPPTISSSATRSSRCSRRASSPSEALIRVFGLNPGDTSSKELPRRVRHGVRAGRAVDRRRVLRPLRSRRHPRHRAPHQRRAGVVARRRAPSRGGGSPAVAARSVVRRPAALHGGGVEVAPMTLAPMFPVALIAGIALTAVAWGCS